MFIRGMRVFQDIHCTEDVDIERTLKERWLSWPWRPWAKTKVMKIPAIYEVRNPQRGMFSMGPSHFLIAHPEKMRELEALLATPTDSAD